MEGEGHSCSGERNRKEVTDRSEGWWSEDVERLIVIRKMTCRKLREARHRRVGVVTLRQLWESYRGARKEVKKAIMIEKKELRKRTVRKIREQGGISCSFGLT